MTGRSLLSHLLERVGGLFFLNCNYDVSDCAKFFFPQTFAILKNNVMSSKFVRRKLMGPKLGRINYHLRRNRRLISNLIVFVEFYRKIHYLTREFRVKLHAKTDIARNRRSDECDIGFQVQFNAEFTSQVMNFP